MCKWMANRQAPLEMLSGSQHESGTWGQKVVPPLFRSLNGGDLLTARGLDAHGTLVPRLRMQGLPSIKANWPAPIGVWRVGAGQRLPYTTRCRAFLSTIKSCIQDSPLFLAVPGPVVPCFRWRHPTGLSTLRQDRLRDLATPSI